MAASNKCPEKLTRRTGKTVPSIEYKNKCWVINGDFSWVTFIKQILEQYPHFTDIVPELEIVDYKVYIELVTFGQSGIEWLDNLKADTGQLELERVSNKYLYKDQLDQFIDICDFTSLKKLLSFSLLIGYSDYARRNIVLRFDETTKKIKFYLIDFGDYDKFMNIFNFEDLLGFFKSELGKSIVNKLRENKDDYLKLDTVNTSAEFITEPYLKRRYNQNFRIYFKYYNQNTFIDNLISFFIDKYRKGICYFMSAPPKIIRQYFPHIITTLEQQQSINNNEELITILYSYPNKGYNDVQIKYINDNIIETIKKNINDKEFIEKIKNIIITLIEMNAETQTGGKYNYNKYLKYKKKYVSLKGTQMGGANIAINESSTNKKYTGAGMLLLEKYDNGKGRNELAIILFAGSKLPMGSDFLYSDLGGHIDDKDVTCVTNVTNQPSDVKMNNAVNITKAASVRETLEESRGTIMIRSLSDDTVFIDVTHKNQVYRCYILCLQPDIIHSDDYDNNRRILDAVDVHHTMKETHGMARFYLSDIMANLGNNVAKDVNGEEKHIYDRTVNVIKHAANKNLFQEASKNCKKIVKLNTFLVY